MVKRLKRATALFPCFVMTLSQGTVNSARTKDDDPQDYSIGDISFDVSNDRVYIDRPVGDSRTSYTVQLYGSSDLKPKHKIDTAATVDYTAEKVGITDKVLKRGAGACYAWVTTEKKARGQGRVVPAVGAETITAEDIMMIKQNRGNTNETKTSVAASTAADQGTATQNVAAQTQAANTQNAGAQDTVTTTGHWVSLKDGGWSYVPSNGQKATGWLQVRDEWYYAGNDGAMWANVWTKSAAEEDIYYYAGYNGEMLVDAQTPDGCLIDYAGKWRP